MDQKNEKKWAEIVAKAWMDPAFKAKLMKNPEAVMKEMGLSFPKGMHPKILENTSQNFYLILPAKPHEDLSEAELKKVAAGFSFTGSLCHGH